MISVEQLLNVYEKRTRVDFEYYLNLFVRDYNKNALLNGRKQTTFFKALEAVLRRCGDKYNYTQLLKEKSKK